VSNPRIDTLYDAARAAGADGGKIAGAGGGGCLLLFVKRRRQAAVRAAMVKAGIREIPFRLEPEGTRIVHFSE